MAEKYTCPVSKMCGGCQWMGESYEQQLLKKQRRVEDLLKGLCPRVNPILGMENPCHYRNKVHAAFAEDERGRIISGVYAQGTHRVIPVEKCLIEDERADEVIAVIRRLMDKFRIRPYDEDSGRGLMRHVLIRVGKKTGQILVVLVIGQSHFPARAAFVQQLVKECPFITSVVVNLNGFKTFTHHGKQDFCGVDTIPEIIAVIIKQIHRTKSLTGKNFGIFFLLEIANSQCPTQT